MIFAPLPASVKHTIPDSNAPRSWPRVSPMDLAASMNWQKGNESQMNILTKNRIIEPGDEYRDGETWKPVPKDDHGLQIMFTKYVEVRRPGEKPVSKQNGAEGTPTPTDRMPKATAERVPSASGTVERKPSAPPLAQPDYPKPKPLSATMATRGKELPTVVSTKAHTRNPEGHGHKKHLHLTATAKAIKAIMSAMPPPPIVKPLPSTVAACANETVIPYPAPSAARRSPIWTGRNGTFVARKLNVIAGTGASEGIIKLIPEGKRGMARNAVIEFPASIIPQLTDWLLRHQLPPGSPLT